MCFFFQAEAGIRGDLVTGVQTCALPICSGPVGLAPSGCGGTPEGAKPTGPEPPAVLSGWAPDAYQPRRQGGEACFAQQIGRASCRERVEIAGWRGVGCGR